jgi:hypothetical protein
VKVLAAMALALLVAACANDCRCLKSHTEDSFVFMDFGNGFLTPIPVSIDVCDVWGQP